MIRFGICGCGGISHVHAECLKRLEEEGLAVLVAGAEVNQGRREAWQRKWNVPVFVSLEAMLQGSDNDVVTITTPSGLHGGQVVQAAVAGRHILCEKPLDIRFDRAQAAVDAAEKAGVTLGGVFQQRFPAGAQVAKRAIDAGHFGRIVSVHCETNWFRTQEYYDQDAWRGTWALDGGVLANQSPHMIDRMMWLGGDIEEILHTELRPGLERNIEAETLAVVVVRLASGAIGTIVSTTLAYPGMPQRVVVCGTEGSCAFSGDELTFLQTKRPIEHSVPPEVAATTAPDQSTASSALSIGAQGHLENIRDFALAIRDKRPPHVTASDALRFTRALDRIYRASGLCANHAVGACSTH